MIISGGRGDRGDELIAPSDNVSCSLPSSGRMEHTHEKGLICGGNLGTGEWSWTASRTCLNLTSSGWDYTNHSLDGYEGRFRHSSWPVADGIILMGGDYPTTELVKFDGTTEKTFGLLEYSAT